MNPRIHALFFCFFFTFLGTISFSQNANSACFLSLSITGLDSVDCPATTTGGVFMGVSGAQGTVMYVLDGSINANVPKFLNVVGAGMHTVIATDAMGCMDTITFTLTDPPSIGLTGSTVSAICNGDNSGTATAQATGGIPPLSYAWQNCTGGNVIGQQSPQNLYAGCYFLTATDSKGCTKTLQVTVGEPPAFQFNSTQDSVDCYAQANGLATIFVSGGTPTYSYKWDNGDLTQTAALLTAGFHSVTVTDAQNCKAVTLVQVLQPGNFNPSTIFTTKTAVSCAGKNDGSMTITNIMGGTPPYTYQWSGGTIAADGKSSTGLSQGFAYVTVTDWHGCQAVHSENITAPVAISIASQMVAEKCAGACDGSIAIAAAGGTSPYIYAWTPISTPTVPNPMNLCGGVYIVTVTDANGCTNTKSITVNSAPAINITLSTTNPKCSASSDGSIQATATGGSGTFTYKWGNNSTLSTLSGIAAGTFMVTATDASGCTKSGTATLVAPAILKIDSLSVVAGIKCFGNSNGSLSTNVTGGTGNYTFKWSDPLMQINKTANNLSAGNFTVTVTDANGCTASNSKVLAQPTILSASATSTNVKCFGEMSGIVDIATVGGTTPYNYLWSNNATTQGLINVAAANYGVTITDKNGCTTTAIANVAGPASPVDAQALQTKIGCFGSNESEATATATGGNGAPFTFKWSNNATSPLAPNLSTGSITVVATDNKGCTDTYSITIAEFTEIVINIAAVPAKCFGSTDGSAGVNIISGGAGQSVTDYSYIWNTTPGQNTALATGLAGGQMYQVIATDNKGCTGSKSVDIPSPAPLTVQTGFTAVSCFGQNDGKAAVGTVQNAALPITYLWNTGDNTQQITNLIAGIYTIIVSDANGCTGDTSVFVGEPTPLVISSFVIEQLDCNGDNNGKAEVIPSGGNPAYDFEWSNGDTGAGIRDLTAGWYVLTLSDANGCTKVDSVLISQPNPILLAVSATDVSCFGAKNGRISIIASGGAQPLQYSLNGTNFSSNNTPLGLESGKYNIFVKDINGCLFTDSVEIGQPTPIQVELGQDIELQLGDSLVLVPSVTNGQGQISYNWKPAYAGYSKCQDTTCVNLFVKPQNNMTVTLIVEDENGCTSRDLVNIKVEKNRGVHVPSGFTPNGDGVNDRLVVFGKSRTIKEVIVFRVYDRWGNAVFEDKNFPINDETRGWDGNWKDGEADGGQYVWFVEVEYIDGFTEQLKGGSMLLR
jgi:gliding motility-associated-like protein